MMNLEKISKIPGSGVHKAKDPLEYLLDKDNMGRTILECLNNNDPDGVIEVIHLYLEAVNTFKMLKETNASS
jgi:hypothetical protein